MQTKSKAPKKITFGSEHTKTFLTEQTQFYLHQQLQPLHTNQHPNLTHMSDTITLANDHLIQMKTPFLNRPQLDVTDIPGIHPHSTYALENTPHTTHTPHNDIKAIHIYTDGSYTTQRPSHDTTQQEPQPMSAWAFIILHQTTQDTFEYAGFYNGTTTTDPNHHHYIGSHTHTPLTLSRSRGHMLGPHIHSHSHTP
jgi:hypothetical protein